MTFDDIVSEIEGTSSFNSFNSVTCTIKDESHSIFPESFEKSMYAYFENYYAAHVISERMEYGEDLYNDAQTLNIFKSLKGSFDNYCKQRKTISIDAPVALISLGVVSGEKYIYEGNRLKGEGLKTKNLSSYETGCWYLFCCQQ